MASHALASHSESRTDYIETIEDDDNFSVTVSRSDTESSITFRDVKENMVHLIVIGEREVSLGSGIESVFSMQTRLCMRDLIAFDAACRPLMADSISLMVPSFLLITLAVVAAFVCAIIGGGFNDIVLVNTSTILLWIALLLLLLAWHPATSSPPLVDMLELKNLAISFSNGKKLSYALLGPVGWIGYFFRAPIHKNITRRKATLRHIVIATLAVLVLICASFGSAIMNLSSKNRPVVSSTFGEHLTCSNATDGYEWFPPAKDNLNPNATIAVTDLCSPYYNMKDLFLSFWSIQILATLVALTTLAVVIFTEPRQEFKMETQARLASRMVLRAQFIKRAAPSPWYSFWHPSSVHSLDIILPATSSMAIFDKINRIRQEFVYWKNHYGPTEDALVERIRRDEVAVRIANTLRPTMLHKLLSPMYVSGSFRTTSGQHSTHDDASQVD